jgi:hypothetical protein
MEFTLVIKPPELCSHVSRNLHEMLTWPFASRTHSISFNPRPLSSPTVFTQTAVLISILYFIAVFFNSYLPVLVMNCFPLEKHHKNFKSNCGNKNCAKSLSLFLPFCSSVHLYSRLCVSALGDMVINNTIETTFLVSVLLSARKFGTGSETRKLNR